MQSRLRLTPGLTLQLGFGSGLQLLPGGFVCGNSAEIFFTLSILDTIIDIYNIVIIRIPSRSLNNVTQMKVDVTATKQGTYLGQELSPVFQTESLFHLAQSTIYNSMTQMVLSYCIQIRNLVIFTSDCFPKCNGNLKMVKYVHLIT